MISSKLRAKFEDFPEYKVPGAKEVHFNPYESNGG